MVRTQCEVVHSHGAVTAKHVLTIRCSPIEGQQEKLNTKLGELGESVSQLPGIVGLHVLRHQAPAMAATTEQKIRGNADRAADWIIVVSGYDLEALQRFGDEQLSNAQLEAFGAVTEHQCQSFSLAYTAIPSDVL